ncbi:chemotaxis protein methyltransferase CheR [Salinibacter ruber]|uniref:protein-glutamate O-methyltransferase n=1 Tax=Salinibacter ruber TaxID=146919 RepID=A0A9X2Q0G4_9BACT|nr:protein-glutamate O-methyltransferase CheR [Salinibacter ruber]MCS3640259.1 chemotaxis protein methyltransferase CheR [Salinibacter ruber]MCS3645377.1 chemotaxis protein methyltransferase CheR [Salinibacter ruber]MCS3677318.1 chemotaxis protein methyltransferase CheR [Salinibacter ruber]MCS3680606.1 chemotaxis protein methyltransferase CheR [Salinibacter ruber]MCS3828835.1 chemotaxis protein methyltransferase CheR [Salinibacter ruber]
MKKPTAAEASLSRQTFNRLRDLVREHAGIDFPDEKRYLLESRVKPRLLAQEVPDFETYADRLEQGDTREIARLVNAVTINETAFFRHPSQFEALEDTILPELVRLHQQERSGPMRLWSAACSAGDEAYSLAILIRETIGPRHPRMDYEIVGTDIDTEVLEEARAGRYRKRSVRNVPPAYLRDYFDRSGEAFVVDPAIRDMVEFRPLNLTDAQDMRRMRNFDLIMCANVLIYFNETSKKNVLQGLYRSLRPGGYLFVGGSEALGELDVPLEPVRHEGALAYRRPTNGSVSSRA